MDLWNLEFFIKLLDIFSPLVFFIKYSSVDGVKLWVLYYIISMLNCFENRNFIFVAHNQAIQLTLKN